jgi:hypothetical protein
MTNNTTTTILWLSYSPAGTINEEMHGGKRFATEWETSNDRRFMVSSVDRWIGGERSACETMVFEVIDGEPTYFDLWTDLVFRDSRHTHGKFLREFLMDSRADEIVDRLQYAEVRVVPPQISELTENSP